MEKKVVVGNEALEEFRERLERWGELCAQLRELYYKYLDLAAFRSDKCYFPGRRCKRSWKRQYDVGDLTLMWTYIANTAPLCGKLMRALAEVEYKIRKRALESLEKYGGVEKMGKLNIAYIRLKRPVYGYVVLWNNKLYVVWGEFNGLPRESKSRAVEIERRVLETIGRYKRGEKAELEVEEYTIDDEYKRLWLEVPLPEGVSKLLGVKGEAPVALFRNLGWLLSDDRRTELAHVSGNPGQTALRLFDWIALVKYVVEKLKLGEDKPLVFKLAVHRVVKTKAGENPNISVRPIGISADVIKDVYLHFGISLGEPKEVIAYGYKIVSELNNTAIKRYKNESVIDDVSSWIALSAMLSTLIIGDGTVYPYVVTISVKAKSEPSLEGEVAPVKELAKALRVSYYGHRVVLWPRLMKLIVPASPVPAFEKTVKLYKILLEYPVAVLIEVGRVSYLLNDAGKGLFKITGKKAIELYELLKRVGVKANYNGRYLYVKSKYLMALARHRDFKIKFLNQIEKEAIKRVSPATSVPNYEALKSVLEKIAEVARLSLRRSKGYKSIVILLKDKSKFEEVVKLLDASGLRFSIWRKERIIAINEQTLVEAILRIMPHLFSNTCMFSVPTPSFYISFVN